MIIHATVPDGGAMLALDTLDGLLGEASRHAEALFDPAGVLMPRIIAVAPDGALHVYVTPVFTDRAHELSFRRGLPAKLRRDGYRRWCFVSEGWMAEYDTDQPGGRAVQPKDREDRVEAVLFAAEEARPAEGQPAFVAARRQIFRGALAARLMPLVRTVTPSAFVTDQDGVAVFG